MDSSGSTPMMGIAAFLALSVGTKLAKKIFYLLSILLLYPVRTTALAFRKKGNTHYCWTMNTACSLPLPLPAINLQPVNAMVSLILFPIRCLLMERLFSDSDAFFLQAAAKLFLLRSSLSYSFFLSKCKEKVMYFSAVPVV